MHILLHLYGLTMCILSLVYCCIICVVASVEPMSDVHVPPLLFSLARLGG